MEKSTNFIKKQIYIFNSNPALHTYRNTELGKFSFIEQDLCDKKPKHEKNDKQELSIIRNIVLHFYLLYTYCRINVYSNEHTKLS